MRSIHFTALVSCVALLVLAAGCDRECETDRECDDGIECNGFGGVCRGGLCTVAPEPACCERDDDCDDGVFCNGPERCDDGHCSLPEPPCREDQTCDAPERTCITRCPVAEDADGDGARAIACGGGDCDDDDGVRHPGATEVCDREGVDEDCDPATFGVRDADGDGYGDADCTNVDAAGETLSAGSDCDDDRTGVHPGLHEACNSIDDDCDGAIDEGALVGAWPDDDGDGWGDGEPEDICAGLSGYASVAGDCDDDLSQVHPGAFRCLEDGESFEIEFCDDDGDWGGTDECPGGGLCVPQPDGTGVCLPGEDAPQCANGDDDDDDDATDFPDDAECSSPLDNSEAPRACANGLDDDEDFATDFPDDPGCTSAEDGSETDPVTAPDCSNGEDDDGDGTLDYLGGTGDPGCTSAADTSERELRGPVCDNGLDDDMDGMTDFPMEATACGAAGPSGTTEESVCMNGVDDDHDGVTDFGNDLGCASADDDSERDTGPNALDCDDTEDNDGDGAADYPGDTGCSSSTDGTEG